MKVVLAALCLLQLVESKPPTPAPPPKYWIIPDHLTCYDCTEYESDGYFGDYCHVVTRLTPRRTSFHTYGCPCWYPTCHTVLICNSFYHRPYHACPVIMTRRLNRVCRPTHDRGGYTTCWDTSWRKLGECHECQYDLCNFWSELSDNDDTEGRATLWWNVTTQQPPEELIDLGVVTGVWRRFQETLHSTLERRLCSAAKKALSKIPTKHIKGEDKEMSGEGECCAICIEFYKASDIVRILPCKHEYHKGCIDPWLLEHRTCPMCKMDILKHYGFVFTGSQESILHMDSDDVIFDSVSFPTNLISPIRTSTIVPVIHSSRMLSEESRASSPNELTPALPVAPSTANPASFGGRATVRAHSSIGTSSYILDEKSPLPSTSSPLRRSLSMDHIFELQSSSNRGP